MSPKTRVCYGLHPVREALKGSRVQLVFIAEAEPGAYREISERARQLEVPVVPRPRRELDRLAAGGVHQGVVALVGEFVFTPLEELIAGARAAGRAPLLLVLDGVQDPQNLGALLRSAHGTGVDGVIIPKDRAVGITPTVVKASAGASEHLRVASVVNLARTLEALKEAEIWVVGAVADDAAERPWQVDFTVPTALVLGSEGKGIRPLVQKGCDRLIEIPMAGEVASLNVSAAGAMLLYEVLRQRALAA